MSRFTVSGVFIAILFVLGAGRHFLENCQNSSLEHAIADAKSGKCELAQDEINRLWQLPMSQPQYLKFRYWRGFCARAFGKLDAAMADLQFVNQNDSELHFKGTAFLIGQIFYEKKNFRMAEISFEQSTRSLYRESASLYFMGDCYSKLEQDFYAIKAFQRVLDLPRTDGEMKISALFKMAELYYERGETMRDRESQTDIFRNQALPAYTKLIEMKEHLAEANARVTDIHMYLAGRHRYVGPRP